MKRAFRLPLIIVSVCVSAFLIYFLVGVYIGYRKNPSPKEFLSNAFLKNQAEETEQAASEEIDPPLEILNPPEDLVDYKITRIRYDETVGMEVEIPRLLSEEQIKLLTEKLKKMYCSEATIITIRYIHYNLEPFYMEIVAEYSYGEPDYEILEYYSPTKKFGLQPD
jgi:hypothetical protein